SLLAFFTTLRPPRSPPFPYTTLFRSLDQAPELVGLPLERRRQHRERGIALRLHVGVGVAHGERAPERAARERRQHACVLLFDTGLLHQRVAHERLGERPEAHALAA